ncbi:MAG: DUF5655 domain-containing protein [Bacteroidota bacterium]
MSWTCPICQKTYGKANQSHYCYASDLHELLRENEQLIALYQQLLARLEVEGEFIVRLSAKAITLAERVGFAVIYGKRDSLDIGIMLPDEWPEFPVYKVQQRSKHKYVNWVRIYDEDDLNPQVFALLRGAREAAR